MQNASPGGRSSGGSARLSEQASAIAEEERLRILAVARGCCPKWGAAPVSVLRRGIELDKRSRCEEVGLRRI